MCPDGGGSGSEEDRWDPKTSKKAWWMEVHAFCYRSFLLISHLCKTLSIRLIIYIFFFCFFVSLNSRSSWSSYSMNYEFFSLFMQLVWSLASTKIIELHWRKFCHRSSKFITMNYFFTSVTIFSVTRAVFCCSVESVVMSWWPMWFIYLYIYAGNETFEKLATIGLLANFMVYLLTQYNMKQVFATNVINVWSGTTNFAPLLGAFVSDAYLGRFRTLAYSSIASLLVINLIFTIVIDRLYTWYMYKYLSTLLYHWSTIEIVLPDHNISF